MGFLAALTACTLLFKLISTLNVSLRTLFCRLGIRSMAKVPFFTARDGKEILQRQEDTQRQKAHGEFKLAQARVALVAQPQQLQEKVPRSTVKMPRTK